jgi:hypothetical protein
VETLYTGAMQLKDAIERYLAVVGRFGEPMPLAGFGVPAPEVEEMLAAWDEDYHLNRHIELVPASWVAEGATAYRVDGVLYTAVVIRETIREVLT